ncbi:MAG: hypothetical protein ACP5GW_06980, partial [Caldisericaceae bacterium]
MEILSVIEVLKWQVGIIKEVDDKVFNDKFYTKDILWSSRRESLINSKGDSGYLTEGESVFSADLGYLLKEVATREEKRRVIPDSIYTDTIDNDLTSDFTNLMQVNPHKDKYYGELSSDNDKSGGYFFYNYVLSYRSIKDYFRGREREVQHSSIFDLLTKTESLTEEEYIELFQAFLRLSKDILLENLDKYPAFLKESLLDIDNYPGEIFRLDLIKEDKRKEYDRFLIEQVIDKIDPDDGDSCNSAAIISFDATYLADYSDLIALAGELEAKGVSVYEALNRIQDFDPDDTIASRFLAEFVSKELNEVILSDLWNKLSG